MPRFKIYYTDGSTFSSDDGEPWQAPGLSVQIIRQYHARADFLTHGKPFYIWKGGRWVEVENQFDLWQYWFVSKTVEPKACLAGETIEEDRFTELYLRAKNDPDF
jgi:hypothetical protein